MTKILIISSTIGEVATFLTRHKLVVGEVKVIANHEIVVELSGIGVVEATFNIQRLILKHNPTLVIQAGIAGYYKNSELCVGDVVVVEGERLADIGVFKETGFSKISENSEIIWGEAFYDTELPRVVGNTVSAACASYVDSDVASIESMEGFSLFYVCRKMRVKYLEIRSISNLVSEDRSSWNFTLASANLCDALSDMLGRIKF